MGTLNKRADGKGKTGGQTHNVQKNFYHSNERNPDNIRNATRNKEYKEHDETLTNDENYSLYTNKIKGDPDFDDKNQNVDKFDNNNNDNNPEKEQ